MKDVKFLKGLIVALIIINVLLLGFILFAPKPGIPEHGGPAKLIIERLHFDETQQQTYRKYIDQHRSAIRSLEASRMELKDKLYAHINEDKTNLKMRDSLIVLLGENQAAIERTHFAHFAEIKSICKPNQKADFELLSKELAQLFGPKKGPR